MGVVCGYSLAERASGRAVVNELARRWLQRWEGSATLEEGVSADGRSRGTLPTNARGTSPSSTSFARRKRLGKLSPGMHMDVVAVKESLASDGRAPTARQKNHHFKQQTNCLDTVATDPSLIRHLRCHTG